ncbi:hypothetical protein [Alicyclobacillus sp. ALC3]|uniref:hypothetical protein n=1 Tax=Alicyclobacillus sp. ALC3 TaxID=2796143 RepID=UPI002378841B|nr:hypothetical protein [Alicyclobacillus sp. ALC3]WDL97985.1 hypothetical protein JC200_04545 [Alicyclobacillus sp. ALC3]
MTQDTGHDAYAGQSDYVNELQSGEQHADTLDWEESETASDYVLFDNCVLRF